MPDLSLLWRKHRHIAPPGTLGVATSSYISGKCGVKGTQATYCALVFVAPPVSPFHGLFDSLAFLSSEESKWNHTLVAANDSAEIKVPEADRRRLEKQLEHDHGGRVQPVWLSDETDNEGVAHFVVGQLQRFGAPDEYGFISAVVLWGSKALHANLSGSRNTRPSLVCLCAATTLPAIRCPTSVALNIPPSDTTPHYCKQRKPTDTRPTTARVVVIQWLLLQAVTVRTFARHTTTPLRDRRRHQQLVGAWRNYWQGCWTGEKDGVVRNLRMAWKVQRSISTSFTARTCQSFYFPHRPECDTVWLV